MAQSIAVNTSTAGDLTLLAAGRRRQARLLKADLYCAAAVTLTFKSTDGTVLAVFPVPSAASVSIGYVPDGNFAAEGGAGLVLTLSASVLVMGFVLVLEV